LIGICCCLIALPSIDTTGILLSLLSSLLTLSVQAVTRLLDEDDGGGGGATMKLSLFLKTVGFGTFLLGLGIGLITDDGDDELSLASHVNIDSNSCSCLRSSFC